MVTKSYQFQINRCNDTLQKENGKLKCHKKEDIDAWIKDVNIEVWTKQEVIDFSAYGKDPYYTTNLIQMS